MADNPRIEELRRRVQADPASIAFAALAEEYRRAGRFDEAIATCTAGLKRHPSYLSAHVTLGRALIEVGRLEDAQDELEFVLNSAPENLAAIRGLAEIHNRRGNGAYPTDEQLALEDLAASAPAPVEERTPPAPARPVFAPSPVPELTPTAPVVLERADPVEPAEPRPDPVVLEQIRALERFLEAIERARGDVSRTR